MQEAAMATKDFVVFDGDSHVVEPPALWEKYLDPEYRTLGKHALWRQEGRRSLVLLDNLVGAGKDCGRDREAERLRGAEVEFVGWLDRHSGGLGTLEDPVDETCGAAEQIAA
jgi:hypothetical protein